MEIISKSTKDTEKIAGKFIKQILKKNMSATVVCLYGDLGTGKTTFTQFVAKSLGIKNKVNSPTFVIMKKYSIPKKNGHESFCPRTLDSFCSPENFYDRSSCENLYNQSFFKKFIHIDAYRLKNEKELLHLGWEEIISNKEHLVFIEWPENIMKSIPKKHHKILISHTKQGHRNFKIKSI